MSRRRWATSVAVGRRQRRRGPRPPRRQRRRRASARGTSTGSTPPSPTSGGPGSTTGLPGRPNWSRPLAFDAHVEVGHGGHFLGAAHTMDRFRDCFYRPLLSSSDNYERWLRGGAKDAAARASEISRSTLADYQPPPLDDAVRAELSEFVAIRRKELGD